MTEKSPVRTVDDVDQSVLDYAEIKALCVGNPKIKEKMDLEHDLKKLSALQAQFKKNLYRMKDSLLKGFPAQITAKERNIENYSADELRLFKGTVNVSEGISPMVIDGISFDERSKAGEAIRAACRKVKTPEGVKIGTYRGFELHLSLDNLFGEHRLTVRGDMPYPIKLDDSVATAGIVTRIDNLLGKISEYIRSEKESLENIKNQVEAAKIEIAKPFPQEEEMKVKLARVTQLNVELSLDAQKAAAGDADLDDVGDDELEYDDDFEHDEDYGFEHDAEYEGEEHETDENIEYADDLEVGIHSEEYETPKHYENTNNMVNTSPIPETLREIKTAAPNNIYIGGINPVAPTSETQNTQATVREKPKRSYHNDR